MYSLRGVREQTLPSRVRCTHREQPRPRGRVGPAPSHSLGFPGQTSLVPAAASVRGGPSSPSGSSFLFGSGHPAGVDSLCVPGTVLGTEVTQVNESQFLLSPSSQTNGRGRQAFFKSVDVDTWETHLTKCGGFCFVDIGTTAPFVPHAFLTLDFDIPPIEKWGWGCLCSLSLDLDGPLTMEVVLCDFQG